MSDHDEFGPRYEAQVMKSLREKSLGELLEWMIRLGKNSDLFYKAGIAEMTRRQTLAQTSQAEAQISQALWVKISAIVTALSIAVSQIVLPMLHR